MTVSGDLLSAASLALGALAVIYGLWSPSLTEALNLAKAQHLADRRPSIKSLRDALNGKALPLMLAANLVCLVLAPPAIATTIDSLAHVIRAGPRAFLDYDPVKALFVVVWVMVAGLARVSTKTWRDVRGRLTEFEQE